MISLSRQDVFYQLYLCVSVERVNTVMTVNKKKRGVYSPSWPLPSPSPSPWNNSDYHCKLHLCQQLPVHLQTVNHDQRRDILPRHRGEEAEETLSSFLMLLWIFFCVLISYSFLSYSKGFLFFLFLRWYAFLLPKWIPRPRTLSVFVTSSRCLRR